MKAIKQSSGFSTEEILQLSQREIKTLERAREIAQKIRKHVGEDDYRNNANMVAAQVEHGISELLEGKIILNCRTLQPGEFAILMAGEMGAIQ